MIGSHNSMSYLPPKNFWGKITRPWNKCQNKTIKEQYDLGVRYFDIRVNFYIDEIDINNRWHFVHNKVDYGPIDYNIIKWLGIYEVPIRLIYDQRSKPFMADKRTELFISFIKWLEDIYHVNIDSAITYWDWKEHKKPSIRVKEYHASVCAKWHQYILGCRWFAEHWNKIAKRVYYYYAKDNEMVLLLDYIDYE